MKFTVLVIGENPEQQLQGFHEFESTGTDDEYVKNIDITKEILYKACTVGLTQSLEYYYVKYFIGDYCLDNFIVENENDIDIEGYHKYGYAIVQNGKLIKAVIRTNPNKKWDYYRPAYIGFILKNKKTNSVALKKDIDFETEIANAHLKAQKEYEEFQSFLSDWPFSYFRKSKEDFIKYQVGQSVVTSAVVKDSQWFSRDEIDWHGTSPEKWIDKFWELVNSVPDDTLFSLYNCHI